MIQPHAKENVAICTIYDEKIAGMTQQHRAELDRNEALYQGEKS